MTDFISIKFVQDGFESSSRNIGVTVPTPVTNFSAGIRKVTPFCVVLSLVKKYGSTILSRREKPEYGMKTPEFLYQIELQISVISSRSVTHISLELSRINP
jgi:hypothetical protein